MRIGNPLEALAQSLAHAQYEGFGEVEYEDRDWEHYRKTKEDRRIKKSRRPNIDEFRVYNFFEQIWSSTALGFGGIGGQAITPAYTIIIYCEYTREFLIYFGGRYCYKIKGINETFLEDCKNRCIVGKSEARTKYGIVE